MRSIINFITGLGQSIQFVAFAAHFFAAGYLMMLVAFLCPSWLLWIALGITGLAAVKEYVFDAKYELNPPQTFLDNTEDFSGWVAGAWITYLIVR